MVTRYGTIFGHLWYICVFIFRLIVVTTIGSAVYGDEQSRFQCSTGIVGCENVCFNEFSKISHIRFWSFQLLALSMPTVFFHFFTTYMNGQIEKLKKEKKLESDGQYSSYLNIQSDLNPKSIKKTSKRKKRIGRIKVHEIYVENQLLEVPFTQKIKIAYLATVVLRMAIESIFIFLGYQLFKILNPNSLVTTSLDFLWFNVPSLFYCQGIEVKAACNQHFISGDLTFSYVPCWVSRAWEKTIILRYMNIMSVLCFLLSAMEFVYLIFTAASYVRRKRIKSRSIRNKNIYEYEQSTRRHSCDGFYTVTNIPVEEIRKVEYDR